MSENVQRARHRGGGPVIVPAPSKAGCRIYPDMFSPVYADVTFDEADEVTNPPDVTFTEAGYEVVAKPAR